MVQPPCTVHSWVALSLLVTAAWLPLCAARDQPALGLALSDPIQGGDTHGLSGRFPVRIW